MLVTNLIKYRRSNFIRYRSSRLYSTLYADGVATAAASVVAGKSDVPVDVQECSAKDRSAVQQ